MEQEVFSIDDLCSKITDGSHFSPENILNGKYPMFSVKDMDYNGFKSSDYKTIDQITYNKLCKSDCRPLKNDILIAKDGSYLKHAFRVKEDMNACILSSIAILRPNIDKINPDYFVYLLRSASIKSSMANYVSGAALPRIILKAFKKMKIKLIKDRLYQDKIASILSTYDDLIEKNNRKIEILQDMAEELYKEWFVRFRFPGYKTVERKESALGSIPSSFDVLKMTDVFDNYIGGGWGNDDESTQYCVPAFVIRGTDFPSVTKGDILTCPYRWHKESNYNSRQLKPNDIVIEISGGTAEQPVGRAILIDNELIKRFGNKVICASFCKQVSLKQDRISPVYFYYWMKFLYETRMIDRFQLQSTGIINFKFEYFVRKGDVLLPPRPLMDKFDNIVTNMRKNISELAEQNNLLKQQRDLLLPRLMSGKLEVKVS